MPSYNFTPTLMKFVKLLLCGITSVSAAILPILTRQMAVEFNRKNWPANLPSHQLPCLPGTPDTIDLSPLRRVLPVSYCDAPVSIKKSFKERLIAETGPLSTSVGQRKSAKSRFDAKKYEKLLEDEDCNGIVEAFKNGDIDFSYMPKKKRFYRLFFDINIPESSSIIEKYFESGLFEDLGPLTYRYMLELAVCRRNYHLANLALDHMILAMLKNVDSVDFKEHVYRMSPSVFNVIGYSHLEAIPLSKMLGFGVFQLDKEEKEMFKFYAKYNRVFADAQLIHWKLGSSDCPICLFY